MSFCIGIYKKKYTWSDLLAMFRMNLTLYVTLVNLSMVLSKFLGLGMLKWIAFFLTPAFLDVILTPIYILFKQEDIS
jgi:hypothetical protein